MFHITDCHYLFLSLPLRPHVSTSGLLFHFISSLFILLPPLCVSHPVLLILSDFFFFPPPLQKKAMFESRYCLSGSIRVTAVIGPLYSPSGPDTPHLLSDTDVSHVGIISPFFSLSLSCSSYLFLPTSSFCFSSPFTLVFPFSSLEPVQCHHCTVS